MTRHCIVNPKTGRLVFKTGVLGRKVAKTAKAKKAKGGSKATSNKKSNNKVDKRTYITFKTRGSFIAAQDMLDAGFELDKVIAKLAFDDDKKVILTSREDGTPYWSTKRIL